MDAINAACSREKSIRHGHPSTLHLWWARRPLAAARAVIFAQLVNDPGYQQGSGFKYGKNKKEAAIERKRLFKIIEDLVLWESTTNEEVLERARAEIRRSWREVCDLNKDHPQAAEMFNPDKLPALHDPFAGGGTIPLEAQRLGLNSYASDLNPVAVLINKAMIEIPPKFAGRPPVSLLQTGKRANGLGLEESWTGVSGLAEDIRNYGEWMRAEAEKRIGGLYPRIFVTSDMAQGRPDLKPLVGQNLLVTAWLWARTVKSPNPAFSGYEVPLAPTFVLSSKDGVEAYVQPIIDGTNYHFRVKLGEPAAAIKEGTKALGRGATFRCILSDSPIGGPYIKAEAKAGRMGQRLLAVVAESSSGRIYLSPTEEMESAARRARPNWKPDIEFFQEALGFRIGNYGMTRWSDLFSSRQLVAMTTFSDLVAEARQKAKSDALASGLHDDGIGLDKGGTGVTAYVEALSVYLSFAVSRASDYWGRGAIWESGGMFIAHVFSRNALPMTWDYPEANLIKPPNDQPLVFIGSSVEALPIARELQAGLAHDRLIVSVWTDGVFRASRGAVESLLDAVGKSDFAVLVLSPDDTVISREVQSVAPRDNCIFELGLFMGALGRERSFIVKPRGVDIKLPSDLLGLTPLEYSDGQLETLTPRIAPLCTAIRNVAKTLGAK